MLQKILQLITPPSPKKEGIEHLIKYNLSYTSVLTCGILLFISCFGQFINLNPVVLVLVTFCVITCMFVSQYIRRSENYRTSIFLFSILFTLACSIAIFFVKSYPVLVPSIWSFNALLLSFYILGLRFGFIFLTYNVLQFVVYFFLINPENQKIQINAADFISSGIFCVTGLLFLGIINWQNHRLSNISNQLLEKTKEDMQDQYDVISKQNEEKTVMLKEIHHRVKNNLQIITSLLRLQARELESPEAIAKFKDSTHRVIAMSMIHEKMYQSDELSSMHLKEYLSDLSNDLLLSYQSGYPVEIEIDCNVETIGLRSIVPLALILNELISNSLKYAFDDENNCKIKLTFSKVDDKNCILRYSDSGTWKPPSRKGSFGMDLIESLTYQLEGTLKIETHPETVFEINFPPAHDA